MKSEISDIRFQASKQNEKILMLENEVVKRPAESDIVRLREDINLVISSFDKLRSDVVDAIKKPAASLPEKDMDHTPPPSSQPQVPASSEIRERFETFYINTETFFQVVGQ